MKTSRSASTSTNGTLSLLLFFVFLSLPIYSHSQNSCHPQDLKALRQIQQALGNPSELSFWQTREDCCSWSPVISCDLITGRVKILRITNLDTVTNRIPDAIGDLPYLESLTFYGLPNLTGGIPYALTRLTRLTFLDFTSTKVSGPVPLFLTRIKTLTNLILSDNQLTGTIPPSLSSLPELQVLYLDRNRLTGVIPESFGNFPPSLTYLVLGDNRLTGTVPRSFGYRNFTLLDLSRNRLTGDVGFLFGKNKTYQGVYLSWNKFTFDGSKIKVNTGGPEGGLQYLDVNHNLITGNLPASLKHHYLLTLNVSYNQMCGEIPKSESLQKFDYTSYFHNKCLCGAPLPPCK